MQSLSESIVPAASDGVEQSMSWAFGHTANVLSRSQHIATMSGQKCHPGYAPKHVISNEKNSSKRTSIPSSDLWGGDILPPYTHTLRTPKFSTVILYLFIANVYQTNRNRIIKNVNS